MTIAIATAKAGPYTGNGVTSSFSFAFNVFADGDIRVVETLTATGEETDLVLNTDYTVSRNLDQDNNPGGTITYKVGGITAALPSTKKLTIVGDFSFEQPTDIPNGGSFFASVIETALDRLTLLVKQLKVDTDRSVKVDVSSSIDPAELIEELLDASTAAVAAAAGAAVSEGNAAVSEANAAASEAAAAVSETNAAASATSSSASATSASASATSASASATSASASATTATAQATSASASATTATTQATNASTSATNASTSATNASTSATNASTSATSASTSASAASASAASAQAIVDSVGFRDVLFKTFSDSPITVAQSMSGKLLSIDTSGGAVTINLPAISGLTLPFTVGVKKATGDSNSVTINRGGSDTFDDATTAQTLSSIGGMTLIPDTDPAPDKWTTAVFGAATGQQQKQQFSGGGVDFTAGSTTTLTITETPIPTSKDALDVFFDAAYQQESEWSYNASTGVITFNSAIPTGTLKVQARWISPLAIGTPADGTVTLAKMANIATQKLIGRSTSGTGVPEALSIDSTTLQLSGGTLSTKSPFNASYDSGDQTITAAGTLTLTHNLGVLPKDIVCFLHCTTAEFGYSIGDMVPCAGFASYDGTASRGVQFYDLTTTQMSLRFANGAATMALLNKTTGVYVATTNANWKLVVRAYG